MKYALGSDRTDKNRAVTRLMYRDGVDQRDHTVATLDDGFYVQGDANQGNTLNLPLTSTLKIQGIHSTRLTARKSVWSPMGKIPESGGHLRAEGIGCRFKVSIGSTGINAGGLTITKVGNGTEDTDAANVGQVNAAKAAATTELVAGKERDREQRHDQHQRRPYHLYGDS